MTRKVFLAMALLAGLGGCSVPGAVTFKYVNNQWVPDSASFSRENITPSEVKTLQDRLNGK
jgi:hypothetical protein